MKVSNTFLRYIKQDILNKAKLAKDASKILSNLSSETKNKILLKIAFALKKNKKRILEENKKDIKLAQQKLASQALIDRLSLSEKRIDNMINILEEVIKLPDPIGEIVKKWRRPNGLKIVQIRIPIGVIGIIYESRPNVTIDATALCLKSSNCLILRGGKEAINTNIFLVKIITSVLKQLNLPQAFVQLIEITNRYAIYKLLKLSEFIDVIIPRGSKKMIEEIKKRSSIPIISHSEGICHIYVDKKAAFSIAQKICFNAKVQRPGVCNAMETLLVHKDIADEFLPGMIKQFQEAKVEIRGCPLTYKICPYIKKAKKKDWQTEYLDLILSIKIVKNIEEAIAHIKKYSSSLADAIITEDSLASQQFLKEINSSAVFVNASTRLTDGNEFGLGAEIGISTQKLHARGPMGLRELTSYKYLIYGKGQIRK